MQPLVSILMPAYKPRFFKEALDSVVRQTHERLEILVGDNAGTGEIEAIVREVGDPRVVCVPTHHVTGGSPRINHLVLWWRASSPYVRFVYDDDVIYPRSTAALLDALQGVPGASLAWHQRHLIDESSHVRGANGLLGDTPRVVLDRPLLVSHVGRHFNFVGEPSFVLFDRRVAKSFDFSHYEERDLVFLWDIAMYLEAARHGPVVGRHEFLGAFRQHGGQISGAAHRDFIFGCIEWELVLRSECGRATLSAEDVETMAARILALYEAFKASVPRLEAFQARLFADLRAGRIGSGAAAFRAEYDALCAARAERSGASR